MEDKRLSQRLESCRQVLQAINQMLQRRQYNQRVLEQMKQLEQLMVALDIRVMTETDMQRIELSTNQLFSELSRLFRQTETGGFNDREMLH